MTIVLLGLMSSSRHEDAVHPSANDTLQSTHANELAHLLHLQTCRDAFCVIDGLVCDVRVQNVYVCVQNLYLWCVQNLYVPVQYVCIGV